MNSPNGSSVPDGPLSVTGAPNLPERLADTFTSRYIDAGGVRLHAVIGGERPGPPPVHGWPENWYAWRLLMPTLAEHFTVIAVDQRGIGLSDKPEAATTRAPSPRPVALMDALGPRALRRGRTRHRVRDRVRPGGGQPEPRRPRRPGRDPRPPGAHRPPPLFVPAPVNNKLWHIPFNRVEKVARAAHRRAARTSSSATSSRSREEPCPTKSIDYYVESRLQPGRAHRQPRVLSRASMPPLAQNSERNEPRWPCRSWRSAVS